jgi:hypothetical protein
VPAPQLYGAVQIGIFSRKQEKVKNPAFPLDRVKVRRDFPLFGLAALAVGALFWSGPLALLFLLVGVLYFLASRHVFQLLWKATFRAAPLASPEAEGEPTLITLIVRAPYQLLGIHQDAGTGTIFRSFYEQVKGEQEEGLRLSKKGRRLAAAKNAMMHSRRQRTQPDNSRANAQKRVRDSLHELLEQRPVYAGTVVQYTNLSAGLGDSYRAGMEVEDLGLTAFCGEESCGRGSCRLVIQSQSGRLLHAGNHAEGGQVVFLPGTRFLVTGRRPWQNPDHPEMPAGFTIELVELPKAA